MADEEPRELTDEESSKLRTELSSLLNDGASEDANDLLDYALAMVTNGKSVDYIVNDLKNMGMDHICDDAASENVGKAIDVFLKGGEVEEGNNANDEKIEDENKVTSPNKGSKRIISLHSKTQNALTMSGALGSGKKGGKKEQKKDNKKEQKNHDKKEQKKDNKKDSKKDTEKDSNASPSKKGNALMMSGALGSSRDGSKNKQEKRENQQRTEKKQKQKQNLVKGKGAQNHNPGRPGGRSIAAEAFKKLAQQRDNDRRQKTPGGRGGRGGGRGDFGRSGRGNGRGNDERGGGRGRDRQRDGSGRGRDERFDQPNRNSGQKRSHQGHQNYDSNEIENRNNFHRGGGGGRGNQDFGRGHGRGRGQAPGRSHPNEWQNKRARHDNQHMETSQNDEMAHHGQWHAGSYQGRGQGWRAGRGGGRGRGRTNESTQAAAEASPSPLVAAEFGTKLSYGGRASSFRGRGFRGRGRGRGFPGRTDVTAMLAAKTWTRSKTTDENKTTAPGTEQPAE